jgi:hypothetical protein
LTQEVCTRLDFNPSAGLGRRLAEAMLQQDIENPELFYIYMEDVTQTFTLAYALTILAKDILQLKGLHFKPQYAKKLELTSSA